MVAKRKATSGRAAKRTKGTRRKATRRGAKRASATKRTKSTRREAPKRSGATGRKSTTRRARTRPPRGPARRKETPKPSTPASATTAVKGAVAGAVAAVSRALPWSSGTTDAITLLEADHRRMEGLLAQGEETTERAVKGRTELLDTLTAELHLHELIEEQVLYPALKAHPEAREIVLEGYQEHHVADLIVQELHQVAKDDERWGAKFKVLKENIEHHIEEEEGEMFRTARAVLSAGELQALGARMAALKARRQ